jgi:nucleotide-binding universal stress UspA family protein
MSVTDDVQRVLVGVDGSDTSARALRWAVSLAGGERTEVLHVFQVPLALPISGAEIYPAPDVDELIADARKSVRRWVEETVPAVADQVVYHVREGAPARELLELARGSDVVVVGSRGLGGFRGMLLGSVSRQVAAHAPCPVVVVPAVGEERLAGGEIIVGVDGSAAARAALRWAGGLAQGTGGHVTALTAMSLTLRSEAFEFDGRLEPLVEREDLVVRGDEMLRELVYEVLPEEVASRVSLQVTIGHPATRLLERAEAADLLVVGSRGLGGFKRLLLGSVSHHCATHATCPVAIIPAREEG